MYKKVAAMALVIGLLILPGCSTKSNFQSHSENLAKRSIYHDSAKKQSLKYAFEALGKIMGFYEEQIGNNSKVIGQKALFTYTQYANNGSDVIGIYEIADVTSGYVSIINNMTIVGSRERVVREFAPIFNDIATSMVEAGDAPKSWVDVASEFVKHVPLVASMGAMYGLSSMAIDKAGTVITSNLGGNASMKLNNTNTLGDGNAIDIGNDNSMIGLESEPEIAEELIE